MRTYNPHTKPHIGLSECCNANTTTIPACFGDPVIVICNHCNKETTQIWKPLYEEIAKGHFRKIEYALNTESATKEL